MKLDFTGRVALVTGAGRGIGRATALAFADAGADVAVVALTKNAESVAAAVLFLASDHASFITAEMLDINGGIYMD